MNEDSKKADEILTGGCVLKAPPVRDNLLNALVRQVENGTPLTELYESHKQMFILNNISPDDIEAEFQRRKKVREDHQEMLAKLIQ